MFRSTSTDTSVTFTFDILRHRTAAVRKGVTFDVDLADLSEEGVRFLLLEGLSKVIGNTAAGHQSENDAKVLARGMDKWEQLKGEKPLRTRVTGLSAGFKAFRAKVIAAAKRDRIKLPKLPDTWDGVQAIAEAAGMPKSKLAKVRKQLEASDDISL